MFGPLQADAFSRDGSPRLSKYLARTSLRNSVWPQTSTNFRNRLSSPFGAHQFPLTASFNISMSRACSATSFFSRAFSYSSDLSCLAIAGAMPPYF